MEPFTKITGAVAPLDRVNVDTDQVIPAVYLKRIERTGYEDFLFASWRYLADGTPNLDFVLNQPGYREATILVSGPNFGCGSSREHAPWALHDYGFRVLICPSFADIFHKNCFDNGIVPAVLDQDRIDPILAKAKANPGYELTVDLESCEISDSDGLRTPFVVHNDPATHDFRRGCLLNGLDDIALTLQHEDKITAYEARHTIT
ncbi:MAG: 3-isopropylmalate dehydratase small subunit [Dehalococcoidia bacterium]|nr:3-isopropylmalate dehydratase small subunit [Dehalococcoidia bacterium]